MLEKFNNKKFNKKNSYKAASSYEELVLDYICSNIDTKEFKYTFEYFVSRNINFIQKIGKAIKLKKKDNIIDIGSGFLGNLKIYKLFKKKNISIIEIEKKFILNCKAILKNIPFEVNFIHNNFFNFKKKKKFDLVICSKFLNIYDNKHQLKVLNKISKISRKYILLIIMKEKSLMNLIFLTLNKFQFLRASFYFLIKIFDFIKLFDLLLALNIKKIKIIKFIFFLETLLVNRYSVKRYVYNPQFYIEFLERNKFSSINSFSDNTYDYLIFKKN